MPMATKSVVVKLARMCSKDRHPKLVNVDSTFAEERSEGPISLRGSRLGVQIFTKTLTSL